MNHVKCSIYHIVVIISGEVLLSQQFTRIRERIISKKAGFISTGDFLCQGLKGLNSEKRDILEGNKRG